MFESPTISFILFKLYYYLVIAEFTFRVFGFEISNCPIGYYYKVGVDSFEELFQTLCITSLSTFLVSRYGNK